MHRILDFIKTNNIILPIKTKIIKIGKCHASRFFLGVTWNSRQHLTTTILIFSMCWKCSLGFIISHPHFIKHKVHWKISWRAVIKLFNQYKMKKCFSTIYNHVHLSLRKGSSSVFFPSLYQEMRAHVAQLFNLKMWFQNILTLIDYWLYILG